MPFTIIDLGSQLNAAGQQIRGLQPEEVIAWLKQHGTVETVSHPYDDDAFVFISSVGIRTLFRSSAEEPLIVIEEHTTRRPE